MKRLAVTALALVFALPGGGAARADIVVLTSGARFEGEATEEGDNVVIKLRNGSTKVPKAKVAEIKKGETSWAEYARRRGEIDRAEAAAGKGANADEHARLARFCRDRKLKEEELTELLIAVRARPDHDGARKDLEAIGWVEYGGRWISTEQMMEEKGFVRHDGKWITRDEMDQLDARDSARRELLRVRDRARTLLAEFRDEKKRESARAELATLPIGPRVQPMVDMLRDPCLPLRRYVVDTLASEMGAGAHAVYFKVSLTDRDAALRLASVKYLKDLGGAEAYVPHYCYYVQNDEGWARIWGANALGDLGDPRAIYTLIYTLYRVTMTVRAQNASLAGMTDFPITTGPAGTVNVQLPQVDIASVNTTVSVPAGASVEMVQGALADALRKLSGQSFGTDVEAWANWWNKEGKKLAAAKPK